MAMKAAKAVALEEATVVAIGGDGGGDGEVVEEEIVACDLAMAYRFTYLVRRVVPAGSDPASWRSPDQPEQPLVCFWTVTFVFRRQLR
eukprot:511460-Prymnesium_polylepis.1